MTPVGIIGIVLSLLAVPFASARPAAHRTLLFFALLVAHLATTVAYYLYVQTESADTSLYYFDRYNLAGWGFGFGTVFTVKLVQFLKDAIGGSYLDYFLLFQSMGFWGVVLLARIFEEIHIELGMRQTSLSYALLFLPGIHFWTSAIGKDAPLFFAVTLAVWATMRLSTRMPAFVISLLIMVLFRPHVALIAAAAIAFAEFFDRRSNPLTKAALLAAAFAGLITLAGTVEATLNVDVSSTRSMGEFFERQSTVAEKVGGTTNVMDASFPVRLLSLLFRPLFFDANGIFAIVASFENLVYIFLFGFLVYHLRGTARVARGVFFLRFAAVFGTLLIILLTFVYYNVGLGARQKMMMVPPVFALFVAHWGLHSQKVQQRRAAAVAAAAERRAEKIHGEPSPEMKPMDFA